MRAVPGPMKETPIEQILEFRADEDARRAFARLRVWMSEMARGQLTSLEIAEKLQDLLSEYENFMRLHRIKTTTGTLETIVVTGLEIAENLVKFQWSKTAKSLFELTRNNVELLEGEQNARGREVAYIAMARERFATGISAGTVR